MHRQHFWIVRMVVICLLSLTIQSCKKEDPNPELRDPIYSDLRSKHGQLAKQLEDTTKKLDTAMEEYSKVEPRSLDVKLKKREVIKLTKEKVKLEQLSEYYRIKAELRRVYARKSYKIAFLDGKDWPNPDDLKHYKKNIELRQAPRTWNHRVPKPKHLQLSKDDMTKSGE